MAFWEVKESPLEMTYVPTGQKIYFRGLDDPLKVTSITVEIGYPCWCWIEEAYEIMNENDFNMLDESIRGAIPEETGLFKQITLTFNPWNEKHWIRKRFFGEITGKDGQGNPTYKFHDSRTSPDAQIFATTTNYLCNEWLNGIQYIQNYKIIIHPKCVNFITEISNYTWAEDKFGAKISRLIDDFNHLMDAMRYALEDMLVGPAFSFE